MKTSEIELAAYSAQLTYAMATGTPASPSMVAQAIYEIVRTSTGDELEAERCCEEAKKFVIDDRILGKYLRFAV